MENAHRLYANTVLFYTWDLSRYRFGNLRAVLELIPFNTETVHLTSLCIHQKLKSFPRKNQPQLAVSKEKKRPQHQSPTKDRQDIQKG